MIFSSFGSGQAADLKSMLGNETQSGEDHAHQALLTNQRQQLLSLCEHLVDKVFTVASFHSWYFLLTWSKPHDILDSTCLCVHVCVAGLELGAGGQQCVV